MSRLSSFLKSTLAFVIKRWYIVVVLIAIAGYFIYRYSVQNANANQNTYTVKREKLEEKLFLSGDLNVEERVVLKFQSGGRLAWVGVEEGDRVQKNQGIASLDQRLLQKTLQKYLNSYSKQRNTFDQTVDNNDQLTLGLSVDLRHQAQRLIDQGQMDLNNAVLDVELQTLAKENAYLNTPIDGIVTRIDTPEAGQNVSVTDQFEIINPDTMYFSIAVEQSDVVKMFEDQQGAVVLDAYPEEEIRGTVTSIGFIPRADESGTTYEVKMKLESIGIQPRVGMTGDVEFVLNEIPSAIAIPFDYVDEQEDGTYVYKQIDNSFEKVKITTGAEYDGMVEIKKGLLEGDVISEIPE